MFGQAVHRHESDVMPRIRVFAARVSQTHNEINILHAAVRIHALACYFFFSGFFSAPLSAAGAAAAAGAFSPAGAFAPAAAGAAPASSFFSLIISTSLGPV